MAKRIVISSELRAEIEKVMEVTARMVYKAIAYDSNTELARRIRKMALEKGGQVIGGDTLETSYPVGGIEQTYGGRLKIYTDVANALTIVYLDGVVRERRYNLSIAEYVSMQQRYIRKVDVQ